jgi:hypothetical protein
MHVLKWLLGVVVLILLAAYVVAFQWPRPTDTTEARVFAADGAGLDYCELPELNGEGLKASEIPRAYTPAGPSCHYTRFPMPVLANCREPIPEGFPDMRGLWLSYAGYPGYPGHPGEHVERIEQCGDRIVVTSSGIIHDFHADGTLENGSRDTEGPTNNCINTWASVDVDQNQVLNFHPFGISSVTVVRRWMEGEELRWKYFKFDDVVRMRRICAVPDAHRVYSPPG